MGQILTSLTSLYISSNNTTDASFLQNLTSLTSLDISSNNIKDFDALVPFVKKELPVKFDVDGKNYGLYVSINPWNSPPIEIVQKGNEAILNYYEELESGEDYLFEAKLLLVGEERAGKSTIADALRLDDFKIDLKKKSTHGIEILPWHIDKGETNTDNDFLFNIWDFGGQEIYHATHQFFLTKRSLYLFVTEARKDLRFDDFYYWLNIINTLADDSPVILLQNKMDQDHKSHSIEEYRNAFPQIACELQTISCDTTHENWDKTYAIRLQNLKNKIYQIIKDGKLDGVGDPLPKAWVNIREKIQEEQLEGKNYITETHYFEICEKHGLNKERALFLSDYFHDLGVFLYFRNDIQLANTIFINHKWVTKAIYHVFDNKVIKDAKGKFSDKDLMEVWSDPVFKDKQAELINLLKNPQFKICYQKGNYYLAPQLFDDKPVPFAWSSTANNLIFQYQYTFMPKGILSQLIVVLHRYIYKDVYWLHGVLFEYKGSQAIVKEDRFGKNNLISIRIEGENKRDLLAIIVSKLEEINNSYTNLEIQEKFGCNCPECVNCETPYLFDGVVINRALKKGKETLECQVSFEDVNISALLGMYISNEELLRKVQRSKENDSENIKMLLVNSAESLRQLEDLKSGQNLLGHMILDNYDYLIRLHDNQEQLSSIETTVANLLKEHSNELEGNLTDWFSVAFQTKQIQELENFAKLEEVLHEINSSSNWESKVKLSVPLLNLIGVNIETKFDLTSYVKNLNGRAKELAVKHNIHF